MFGLVMGVCTGAGEGGGSIEWKDKEEEFPVGSRLN